MNDAVLYLEVDEDITSAIDKLSKTPGKSVQIVVPKRSTMLQSIINQKLLKKAAADSGKELVLVTNDRIAKNLAASVGLAVAASVGAEAIMSATEAPKPISNEDIIEEDDEDEASDAKKAAALAASAVVVPPAIARKKIDDKPSTKLAAPPEIVPWPAEDLGEELPADDGSKTKADSGAATDPQTTSKKLPKVPNFGVLKRRMLWVGAAAFLVIGYFVAMAFLTKATVKLFAIGSSVNIDTSFWVDTNATKSDVVSSTLAGQSITLTKDLSGPFTPTGTKDVGTQATGTMTVVNNDPSPHDFVAGTRFQAPDGKIFKSDADVHVAGLTYKASSTPPFAAIPVPGRQDVAVTSDQAGDSYNEAPAKYTIPGLSAALQNYTYGQGGQMAGGTSKTITIVAQADVDKAQADMLVKDKDGGQKELDAKVPSGYMALPSSSVVVVVSAVPSPAVGAEASTGTLALKVTYSELAVPTADYTALILNQEQNQVGGQNEVYDNGIPTGQVTLAAKNGAGLQGFRFTTVAYGGPKFDKVKIANDIKGKRYGDAVDIVSKYAGVDHAEISLWPSWASNLPRSASKITINIQIANNK